MKDIKNVKIKEPMNRFITWNFMIIDDEPSPIDDGKQPAFAVNFLYEGQIVKEYVPIRSANEQLIALGFDNGQILPKNVIITPKHRKDIGLLRYSLQRLKAEN